MYNIKYTAVIALKNCVTLNPRAITVKYFLKISYTHYYRTFRLTPEKSFTVALSGTRFAGVTLQDELYQPTSYVIDLAEQPYYRFRRGTNPSTK